MDKIDISQYTLDKTHIIQGHIKCDGEYGEAWDILLVDDKPLALTFKDLELSYSFLSVCYYISEIPIRFTDVQDRFTRFMLGDAKVIYHDTYSEITGYLWTDEDLVVGGHDLISEIGQYDKKYLNLQVKKYLKRC